MQDEKRLELDAQSSDPERRSRAIDALLALGPGAVPIVVESLRSAGEFRWLVAERMVRHGAGLSQVFRQLLHDEPDREIRVISALALYTLGQPDGERVLVDAVQSGSEWELLAATRLTAAKSSQVVSALLARLRTIPPTKEREASIARLLQLLLENGEAIPLDVRSRFSGIRSPYLIEPLLKGE